MEIKLKRKAFEAWHESKYGEHIIWSNGSPVSHIHNDRWQGWLAATAKAQTVPEGFVLVPREPTDVMRNIFNESWVVIYKAMIEAAEKEMIAAQGQSHDGK